jgi:hypothetical protein
MHRHLEESPDEVSGIQAAPGYGRRSVIEPPSPPQAGPPPKDSARRPGASELRFGGACRVWASG